MTLRTRAWLTPATAVLAVAIAATVVSALVVVGWHILGKLPADPAAAAATPRPEYTVAGKIRLPAGQYERDGQGCRSAIVGPDAQVIVTDARGASLAYAPVGAGTLNGGHCDLPFTLAVRAGEGSYGIDVPSWGLAKYSEQELAGTLDLTFG